MIWAFDIIDRVGTVHEIEEPPGWDADVPELNRDENLHGIFFESRGSDLEFYGTAERLLRAEYEQHGAKGDMTLVVKFSCGGLYEEVQRAKFLFIDYSRKCGEKGCYIKIPLESVGDVMNIRNRWNQKVNLESLKAFDETTDLTPYENMPLQLELPSKGILLQNLSNNEEDNGTPVAGCPVAGSGGNNSEFGMIEIGMDKFIAGEIGAFSFNEQPRYQCTQTNAGPDGCNSINKFVLSGRANSPYSPIVSPLDISAIVNYAPDTPGFGLVTEDIAVDVHIMIDFDWSNVSDWRNGYVIAILPEGNIGDQDAHFNYIASYDVNSSGITIDWVDPKFRVNKGDRLYIYCDMYHQKTPTQQTNGLPGFSISIRAGSYFRWKSLTHTKATISDVFMIMETWSRVVESITNNKVKAYSEYFGRIDSQPYPVEEDGCGGLEIITDGLRIRRAENSIESNKSVFSISLQDLFDGLNPIHNIGIGIENDAKRYGFNRIRIEPWKYFYKDDVVMSCSNVANIERKAYSKYMYSTFTYGYSKWEAEEYNGLDEFLTKRIYRTSLSEVKNDLIKLSRMIAYGYAGEVTRRKGPDSKDWRYDKETFIICVKRERTFHVVFDAATNSMTVDYIGDPALFSSLSSITIANSVSNNATRAVDNVTIFSSQVLIEFTTGATVDENCYTVTFPSITFPDGYFVELGNIDTPTNIIDPPTIYNWRIRPLYNAMRWANRVLCSYKQFDANSKLIFTDGDANYFASGEMLDTNCKLENNVYAENVTINSALFDDEEACAPFMGAERIVFDYPMSVFEYKSVKANPYGLIYFNNDCEEGYGWIDKLAYTPEKGMAKFTLIPKIES